jgi:ABC-2 type transport system ATP-binding protein
VPSAIGVQGVSKRFRLHQERYTSLKERIIHFGRGQSEDFWALRDIDLEVAEGETVGLLGHNGSGKSTLLKCIAGILRPTTGEIITRGRLAALLELGAGFQAELTGRENIFLNGAILGMSKREVARRFDAIVDFAELEQFIDTQVRFYSSGMYVRLGFAVAVNVEPDLLLIDEVLAVGDEAFQRKCIDRVRQFQREGRTIVFVTHAADQVRQICDRAVVLDHGQMVAVGEPGEVIRTFREHLLQHERYEDEGADAFADEVSPHTGAVRITDVQCLTPGATEAKPIEPGQPLDIHVSFDAAEPTDDANFSLLIYDIQGALLHGYTTVAAGIDVPKLDGRGELVFSIDRIPLLDGDYSITVGVGSHDGAVTYDWHEQRYRFEVMNPGNQTGLVDLSMQVTVRAAPGSPDRH